MDKFFDASHVWLYIGQNLDYAMPARRLMRKNLSAIGNSLGLVIEKPILELLGITRDTELEVTTDGTRLIVEPVRAPKVKRSLRVTVPTSKPKAEGEARATGRRRK